VKHLPHSIDDYTLRKSVETFRIAEPFPVTVVLAMPDYTTQQAQGVALEYVPGPWGAVRVAIPWPDATDGILTQWYDSDRVTTIRPTPEESATGQKD